MINVGFLIVAYLVSLITDWVFQSEWQAVHKSKWSKDDDKLTSLAAVSSHAAIYTLIVANVTHMLYPYHHIGIVLTVLFISHMIIDTRIPVKLIMRLKGMSKDQINDYNNFGFMHIGIDQRLHELVLLILALYV